MDIEVDIQIMDIKGYIWISIHGYLSWIYGPIMGWICHGYVWRRGPMFDHKKSQRSMKTGHGPGPKQSKGSKPGVNVQV
jgi:hypothetical protein